MALIKCPECSTQVSDKAASCPSCGCPIAEPVPSSPPPSNAAPATVTVAKSRGTYIILGLLFGWMGFHNFYSGHNMQGGIKIGVFLIAVFLDATTGFHTAFSLIVLVLFAFWSLIEVIVVKNDARGNAMA